MIFANEHLGTRLAVVFDLTVPTAARHERLARVGNPVLHAHDSTGVYLVGVPDGQDYYWVRTYRGVPGVVSAEIARVPARP